MEIICILGRPCQIRYELADALVNLGYHKIVQYTTRNPLADEINHKDYHFISYDEKNRLTAHGMIAGWLVKDGFMYGIPHPVGYAKYVIVATPQVVEILRKFYSKQVKVVVIDDESDENTQIFRQINPDCVYQETGLKKSEYSDYKNKADVIIGNSDNVKRQAIKIIFRLNSQKISPDKIDES